MKYFALLALAVAACVEASIVNTGSSQVMRKDDGHGNYAFAYDEQHHSGGSSRSEKGGHGWQSGSYTLNDADGRKRIVNYVADAHGFRADIKTNEPGVDSKEDPASVSINGGGKLLIAAAEPVALAYGGGLGLKGGLGLGYAAPEAYGYGGLGGHGGGISGSYSAHINHVSAPALHLAVAEPRLILGGHGKW